MMRYLIATVFLTCAFNFSNLFGQFYVQSSNGSYSVTVNFSNATIQKWNVQSGGFNYTLTMNYQIIIAGTGIPTNAMYDLRGVVIGAQQLAFSLPKTPTSNSGTVTTSPDYYSGNPNTVTMSDLIKRIKMVFQWNEINYKEITLTINPLPIELLSFNATAHGNQVELDWSTGSERNNDYFTIEKTIDGLTYETVAEVKGSGSSSSKIDYKYTDTHPSAGISYYRLKQTDFNGEFEYFEPKSVQVVSSTVTSSVFPNPAIDSKINVHVLKTGSMVELNLYNMYGQLVSTQLVNAIMGDVTEVVALPELGNTFFVELIQENVLLGRHQVLTAR